MKGFMFILAGIMFIMVFCGFAVTFPFGENSAIIQFFRTDAAFILGSVFFAIGLLWPKRILKK